MSPLSPSVPSKLSVGKNSTIFILDVILFLLLINFLPFTPEANRGLALLAFVAILWLTEAVHVTVTAILVPLLSIVLGLATTKSSLTAFSNPTIFLFFGGFALSTALHIQKLDRLIADKIMQLAKGRLFLAVIYIFITTGFLSMWMSNTATAAMMLPLALGILSNLDREKDHNTYVFVLLGIAYSATIGGMGTLVGSPPNAIVASELNLTFADWLLYGTPVMMVLFPLMVATLYIIYRPKLSIHFSHQSESVPMNKKRYLTLLMFIVVALCWIFSSKLNPIISSLLGLKTEIGNFDAVIALFAAVFICVTRIASWKQLQEGTEWGVLYLFGGGLTLSAVLKDSGASQILADGIVFLIQGGHYYLIALMVACFIVFLTEFTSNTASAALLVPIFVSISEPLGLPPLGLALIIGIGASCAFSLPVATPPNAIIYGSGEVAQKEMLRAGIRLDPLCILMLATFAYLFWF
ncbi:sodium-dependent dicarboxylate transporter 2/3/5 [Cricetibacter osteomyelitidis]|uniref:Sodium-dependent dicarboxylate transporter 2/3/5 n=1 Tax=Cricetibacter osteomyelitidis TaxID=1521931 RepID=A0A4V6NS60_9PAST|nr:DASS family sodium-coupled anion symporter [Cricetibacter osteomyelitidis]TCP93383.1 sodium-dependent dicarboxylate transporter 2/3/5 [Cricetibacter osteomyelitidis]